MGLALTTKSISSETAFHLLTPKSPQGKKGTLLTLLLIWVLWT